jgi:tetratricopeptide (TPR) repeat protein
LHGHTEKTERRFIKLIIGGIVGLFLFITLAVVGVRLFHQWQERHLVRVAAAHLSGGDPKAAMLPARRALQLNPDNVDAARLIAQIADRGGDKSALDWWRKVVALPQHTTEDVMGLVRSALRVNDLATAEKALSSLDDAARQTAGYHAACGHIAEMRKNVAEAEKHWAQASALAPDNLSYQFQLALTLLGSNDSAKRQASQEILERLRSEPTQRAGATRALILDGVAHSADVKRMQALAAELDGYPEATLADRLLYLEILRQLHDPAFEEYLAKLEREAVSNPVDLASLFSWMSGNETASAGIEFARTLPAESREKWPVPPAIAALYSGAKDWPGLEEMTRNTKWESHDFLRRAFLSRALRGQDKTLPSEQEWVAAQKEASTQPQSLLMLARTVALWGWENETTELLWLLAKNHDTRTEALQTLYQHYADKRDTAGLYRTLVKLVETMPNDLVLQNNLAQVSLLLGANVDRARKIAAEVSGKDPSNASFVSTYAFSLYTKGDIKGALQAMDKLTPDQLRDASLAAYYGVVLAAAGQKEKAREYLRRASEAKLLPEEKALVAKSESSLN